METPFYYLIPLFFVTALIYSSVGFGGGSTYLALLVLFNFPYESMPKVALLCNLVVVSGGLYHYVKNRHLSIHLILPFIVTSIPFAYLGGKTPIQKPTFLLLLAISLVATGLRLLFTDQSSPAETQLSSKKMWMAGLPLGAFLGFFSGSVGIGGGIFLAPILYFLGWGNAREIAAGSCFFIFVNSLSGLLGQLNKGNLAIENELIFPLIFTVFIGGQIGSKLSVGRIPLMSLQRITAVLILFVSAKMLWRFL